MPKTESQKKSTRESQKRNQGKYRRIDLSRRYGISLDWFDEQYRDQDGKCAACGEVFSGSPHVDHDHSNGNVRALLCKQCNFGVGYVEHRLYPRWVEYVQFWNEVWKEEDEHEPCEETR